MIRDMLDGYPDELILGDPRDIKIFWLHVEEDYDDVEGGEAAIGVETGDGGDEGGFLGRGESGWIGEDTPERHDDSGKRLVRSRGWKNRTNVNCR